MSGRSWSSREELGHQVVALSRQGMSQRAIARTTGVSRNTVQVLLAQHSEQRQTEHSALGQPPKRAPRATKLDAFGQQVAALLAKYPDITAQRVLETLRDGHRWRVGGELCKAACTKSALAQGHDRALRFGAGVRACEPGATLCEGFFGPALRFDAAGFAGGGSAGARAAR